MRKLLIFTLVMLLSAIGILTAQDRGMVPAKSGSLPESPYKTSWALLIGINKYPDLPTQYQLSYAVNDVNDMKKVLSYASVPAICLILLLCSALQGCLYQRVDQQDIIVAQGVCADKGGVYQIEEGLLGITEVQCKQSTKWINIDVETSKLR